MIVELARKDKSVFLISGDNGIMLFDKFREQFPNRFLNLGIREQSIIGIASGMALMGLKPYVYTITPFLIERPYEQIKLDIDQQKANVKLVGFNDYPNLGPTHEVPDLKGLIKRFKNIVSYFPENLDQTRQALLESYESQKPTFIGLKRYNLES